MSDMSPTSDQETAESIEQRDTRSDGDRLLAWIRERFTGAQVRDTCFWLGLALVGAGAAWLLSLAAAAVLVGTALFGVAVFGVARAGGTGRGNGGAT